MIGCLVGTAPSSLTASPRLLVKTFRHTLRGGIVLKSFSFDVWLAVVADCERNRNDKGMKVFLENCAMPGPLGKVS